MAAAASAHLGQTLFRVSGFEKKTILFVRNQLKHRFKEPADMGLNPTGGTILLFLNMKKGLPAQVRIRLPTAGTWKVHQFLCS